ncbi:hypothetical protein FB567DRAFT_116900 [Paraphoma chrysanthemicola]|uniref:GAT domain-containing protein n=1 Tax=Paraphoma chrysanthemicola TaxID=798071 RepID=A0A8K0R043_9PLEO|nr:hypothetical protein FB567DRAFT_116900 [Paraphoma chrysanthemicola]
MELKKRLNLGSLMRKRSSQDVHIDPNADTPESNAARGVRLFCESGAANSGEEVLHLPTIVESAVASPTAAAAAAQQIRKFLSKENYDRPHVQYNAVMLIRILADNPGQSFTKNLDKQFADTVKHLLRNGQDPSVSQIVRESMDSLEREKAYDTNLNTLFAMWRKEKGLMASAAKQVGPRKLNAPAWNGQHISGGFSSGGGHSSRSKGLPPPVELAGRIEEARTSAKLLLQLVQSTPANELIGNDLVKEFAERCTAAQRSIQGYIACDNPAPDDDTMLTLIETNEQLSLAASKHQRAVLQARRVHGGPSPSPPISQVNSNNIPTGVPPHVYDAPGLPPRNDAPSLPPINTATTESGYVPPPNPSYPPPQDSNFGAPANTSYAAPPTSSYSPPPTTNYAPPPTNPVAYKNDELPLPPSLQAGGQRQPGPPASDDPFADHHTSTYTPPPGAINNPRSNGYDGSPEPYHPGYQSTPSYLGRQESSTNNLTMHGAAPRITEEEEYARDYPAGQGPRTPDANAPRQTHNDVSPIAERNTVTYRY